MFKFECCGVIYFTRKCISPILLVVSFQFDRKVSLICSSIDVALNRSVGAASGLTEKLGSVTCLAKTAAAG